MRWHTTMTIGLFMSLLCASRAAGAGDGDLVFDRPPAPDELAAALYSPKYRSVDTQQEPGRFAMRIEFARDSARILPESLPLLDSVGEMLVLPQTSGGALIIEGHADASGSDAYNQRLSERRAAAIKRFLVAAFDIEPARLIAIGAGESRARFADDPYAAANRCVVFRAAGTP